MQPRVEARNVQVSGPDSSFAAGASRSSSIAYLRAAFVALILFRALWLSSANHACSPALLCLHNLPFTNNRLVNSTCLKSQQLLHASNSYTPTVYCTVDCSGTVATVFHRSSLYYPLPQLPQSSVLIIRFLHPSLFITALFAIPLSTFILPYHRASLLIPSNCLTHITVALPISVPTFNLATTCPNSPHLFISVTVQRTHIQQWKHAVQNAIVKHTLLPMLTLTLLPTI